MRFSAKVKRCTESLQSGPTCQWLPLWGSWREAPERARMLPENHKHSDSIALTEGLLIAARRLSGDGLALSVTFGATSPIGRGTGVPVRPTRDEQSLFLSETVVPCYRGQQLLDKSTLSSCCESL